MALLLWENHIKMNSGPKIERAHPHPHFVKQVAANKTVWGLKSSDGWAMAPSNQFKERNVMPFWSDRALAKSVAVGEWASWQPTTIKLDAFINLWLKGMKADNILVGTNWDVHLTGKEIEPDELEKEIRDALEQYNRRSYPDVA